MTREERYTSYRKSKNVWTQRDGYWELLIVDKNAVVLVDDIDYEKCSQKTWHISSIGYAATHVAKKRVLSMQQFVLDSDRIYRRDDNKLDNRRINIMRVNNWIEKESYYELYLPRYNKTVLVDKDDYSECKEYTWGTDGHGYIQASLGIEYNCKMIYLHRLVAKTPKDSYTDHVNGNKLDNRKCNLRICTCAENGRNSRIKTNRSSKFKGVHLDKKWNKWVVRIRTDTGRIVVGSFYDEIEAAKAYDLAAIKYHGSFAKTNTMLGILPY